MRLPHLSDYPVQLSKTANYRGVTFDSKLNCFAPVDCKVEKANAILWQCVSAAGQNWGFSSKKNVLDISNHSQIHALIWVYCLVICLYQAAGSAKATEAKPHWLSHDYRWNEINKLYNSSAPDRTNSI